ncbi:MAG: hypothetical protein GY711_20970 [bacterium]|nr:hypothetical protein [bacterium]
MDVPTTLNLGSGKDFRADCLNVDVLDRWGPDIVADLNEPFPGDRPVFRTERFGEVHLERGSIDRILAVDVLEHVAELQTMMTSCLELLALDGTLRALVPYDLSFGAWQDPTHLRAFNERSWLYYTDWFWYMGWTEARFVLDDLEFSVSDLGRKLQASGTDGPTLLRTPRAVDSMVAELRKVPLTDADQAALARHVPAQLPRR